MTVIKRKNGNFEVRVIRKAILRAAGIPSGIYTFTMQDENAANEIHDKLCLAIDNGHIPAEIKAYASESRAKGVTITDAYRRMSLDPLTKISKDNQKILRFIEDGLGDVLITAFTYAKLTDWIQEQKQRGNAPSTIRNKVNVLKRLFGTIKFSQRGLSVDAFAELPKGYSNYNDDTLPEVVNVKRTRRLEDGEEDRLYQAINDYRLDPRSKEINGNLKPTLTVMLQVAVATGMRLQEIFLVKRADIDLRGRGQLNLPSDICKYKKARDIPMTREIKPIIETYIAATQEANHAELFPFFIYYGLDREKCSGALSKMWQRVIANAELDDFIFHDLRHEAISRLVERTTLTVAQMMKITGHADSRTFDRYNNLRAHVIAEDMY